MSRRKKILWMVVLFCVGLTLTFLHSNSVARAWRDPDLTEQIMCGRWTGSYDGYSGATEIQRALTLDIDYSENGIIEGIATVDNGAAGSYFFEGTFDIQNGRVSFRGTEWIKNVTGLSFASFEGYLDQYTMTLSGVVDGKSDRSFLVQKTSDEYETRRIDVRTIPKEWSGEYDGHHGSTVVRRDYEIHIQSIDENGTIKGVAIIAPSSKADAAYGANGSYYFSGSIDAHKGKIKLQGTDWIEYPASYSSFGFVYLEGSIIQSSLSIEGKSEDGIWEMKAIDYGVINSISGFELGKDNNSFIHSSSDTWEGAGFVNVTDYSIDSAYFQKLIRNSDSGEINQIKKSMNSKWGGSCYGIAMSMGLLYEGLIGIDDLTNAEGKDTYYSLDYPGSDKKLLNMINYYQLSQGLKNGGKESAAVSWTHHFKIFSGLMNWIYGYDSLPVFLKKMVEYCANDHVELLGFSTSKSGHAVLITGCEYDESTGKYKIEIYDENCIRSKGDIGKFSYMYVEKDYSGFTYTDANGDELTKASYVTMYFLDWNSLSEVVSATSSDYYRHLVVDFPIGEPFRMTDNNGNYLAYDGENFSGNVSIYGVSSKDYGDGSRIVLEIGDVDVLNLTELGDTIDINACARECFMGLSGKGIEQAVINFDEGIDISGESYTFEAFITTEERINETEKGLLSLSATAVTDVAIRIDGQGIVVTSEESLSDVETGSYRDINATRRNYQEVSHEFTVNEEGVIEGAKEVGEIEEYSISYELNGGQVTGNPEIYTCETETFTLINPTKDECEFLGWTGSNGDEPEITVSIEKGTTGDLTFTANWTDLKKPTEELPEKVDLPSDGKDDEKKEEASVSREKEGAGEGNLNKVLLIALIGAALTILILAVALIVVSKRGDRKANQAIPAESNSQETDVSNRP